MTPDYGVGQEIVSVSHPALDSRFRGNDGIEARNDGDGGGSDGDEAGNDCDQAGSDVDEGGDAGKWRLSR